ncbi:purine-binding chemotaxis protein CheW [Azospirillum picis]|uniref:Purine-binding chemotaxis protein CheW n=2 Tax=Azospirillum picis TaxID=488438 RepID=A0ABU0MVQ3_9PROT|nr:purine-binding chemotaxis protein CheW [Azospirillum picis]MDQ0537409.1 purine-binding chemotaxis protein CheW [Azospirillum picis]
MMTTKAGAAAMPTAERTKLQEGRPVQFVAFKVNGHDFAVDIMAVQEIKAWSDVSSLPNMPPYVRGVLNLRGNIVPIFDLRCRFGQGLTEATRLHVVIILLVQGRTIGILVDAVSDILKASSDLLRDLPEQGDGRDGCVCGLLTAGDRMIALLDPARLINQSLTAIAAHQGI